MHKESENSSVKTIQTLRLVLNSPKEDDAVALSSLMTQAISARLATWPYPYTVNAARSRLDKKLRMIGLNVSYARTVRLIHTGAIIGWFDITKSRKNPVIGELGFWIGENYQAQHFMSEALPIFSLMGSKHLGLHFLDAVVQRTNLRSISLIRKLGMSYQKELSIYSSSRGRHELWLSYRVPIDGLRLPSIFSNSTLTDFSPD